MKSTLQASRRAAYALLLFCSAYLILALTWRGAEPAWLTGYTCVVALSGAIISYYFLVASTVVQEARRGAANDGQAGGPTLVSINGWQLRLPSRKRRRDVHCDSAAQQKNN